METDDYPGFVAAMEARRRYFIAHGGTSADHSHEDVRTDPLEAADADRIYRAALAGEATAAEAVALRRHMLLEMARMSCEDGLVMTLHPAVRRGHHGPTSGALRGRRRRRHPDPGRVHRRAAPAAGALRHASRVPPRGVHARRDGLVARARAAGRLLPVAVRGRAVVVPRRARGHPALPPRDHRDVGFSRTSGFIDDTRAFCSIPARHDMSRRLDAGWVAELVAQHLLDRDEAAEVMVDLVSGRPTEVFKL